VLEFAVSHVVEQEVDDLELKLEAARADIRDEYLQHHDTPWIIGFSGGKDSTLVLQLVVETLLDLPPSERNRPVHVVSNDTLVEAPVVADHVDRVLDRVRNGVEALRLPLTVVKTLPKPDQTFWVNLIGRGYPSPSRTFRWCTDRMKIQPTSHYIKSKVVGFHAELSRFFHREVSHL
jgi:DNA sulfur modification protein DndC